MEMKSRQGLLILSALSGLLLSFSWPESGIAYLIFTAFVPLLFVQNLLEAQKVRRGNLQMFLFSYFSFLIFNLLTTWWVKYASLFGAIAAITLNAAFMATVFLLFHVVKKRLGLIRGMIALVAFWVSFEHLHMDWDLSWPWLTLGNVFATQIKIIQWYEYTGTLGGTAWILIINVLLFQIIRKFLLHRNIESIKQYSIAALLFLAGPIGFSMLRYHTYNEKLDPVDVAVIQPNIDPYNEKFSGMSYSEQLNRILSLADSSAGYLPPDYFVAPETALPSGMWEDQISNHPQTKAIRKFLDNNHGSSMLIGAATNKFYPDSNLRSITARRFTDSDEYYDSYNTALQFGCNNSVQVYHKSRLVPGVEKMPFPWLFSHIEDLAIDLGGITGSLGVQGFPSVFNDSCNNRKITPVICYESIYGDYIAHAVRNKAGLIFIITNDGWWGDTPGYRQHRLYASLRAVEFRRSIARSANTGISCFINQKGDEISSLGWWKTGWLRCKINYNSEMTFYAQHGDYIGSLAMISGISILIAFVVKVFKKGNSI